MWNLGFLNVSFQLQHCILLAFISRTEPIYISLQERMTAAQHWSFIDISSPREEYVLFAVTHWGICGGECSVQGHQWATAAHRSSLEFVLHGNVSCPHTGSGCPHNLTWGEERNDITLKKGQRNTAWNKSMRINQQTVVMCNFYVYRCGILKVRGDVSSAGCRTRGSANTNRLKLDVDNVWWCNRRQVGG